MSNTETSGVILQFPADRIVRKIETQAQSLEELMAVREDHCRDVAEDISEMVMAAIGNYGFLEKTERFDPRDEIMITAAIQAFLYRYKDLEHPLHEVVDEMFGDVDIESTHVDEQTTAEEV